MSRQNGNCNDKKRKDVVTRWRKNGLIQHTQVNVDNWNSQGEGCLSQVASNFLAEVNCSQGKEKTRDRVGQRGEELVTFIKTRSRV